MAAQLQDSINWVEGYVQGMPVSAFTGNNPALQIASMVRATILAPPFNWSFNRNSTIFTTTAGVQDYSITTATDFGYAEQAAANDGTTSWQIPNILNTQAISISTTKARPMTLAIQTQVPGVSFSVRLAAVPDAVYTVELIYQKSAVQFSNLTDLWAPIPDGYDFIFNNLFLGEILADADDPRSQVYRQRGIASLLARAEGLTNEDRAVFMAQYMQLGAAMSLPASRSQQAIQARAV